MRTKEVNRHRIICRKKVDGDFKVIVYKPNGVLLYIETDFPKFIGTVGRLEKRGWTWRLHPRGIPAEAASKDVAIQNLVDQWDLVYEAQHRRKMKRLGGR